MAQGYHDFTAGEVLTAANLEDYCQNQSVMRFASAAARDTALSGVLTEGMMAYLIDTNSMCTYTGSAWSTVGPVHGAGTSWTPTVTQSGSVTVTVTNAVYWRLGRLVLATARLDVTGSGTGANGVVVSLPVTAAASNRICGTGMILDSSASTFYSGMALQQSTTTCAIIPHNATSSLGAAAFTAGLASGDVIYVNLSYEASADA